MFLLGLQFSLGGIENLAHTFQRWTLKNISFYQLWPPGIQWLLIHTSNPSTTTKVMISATQPHKCIIITFIPHKICAVIKYEVIFHIHEFCVIIKDMLKIYLPVCEHIAAQLTDMPTWRPCWQRQCSHLTKCIDIEMKLQVAHFSTDIYWVYLFVNAKKCHWYTT